LGAHEGERTDLSRQVEGQGIAHDHARRLEDPGHELASIGALDLVARDDHVQTSTASADHMALTGASGSWPSSTSIASARGATGACGRSQTTLTASPRSVSPSAARSASSTRSPRIATTTFFFI